MYGIFTYIYHKNQPNVGIYTIQSIHGSYWKRNNWIPDHSSRIHHPGTIDLEQPVPFPCLFITQKKEVVLYIYIRVGDFNPFETYYKYKWEPSPNVYIYIYERKKYLKPPPNIFLRILDCICILIHFPPKKNIWLSVVFLPSPLSAASLGILVRLGWSKHEWTTGAGGRSAKAGQENHKRLASLGDRCR